MNTYAQWTPKAGISGSATGGRVFVETMNADNGTATVRFDCGDGTRSKCYCAKITDLDFLAPKGWRELQA